MDRVLLTIREVYLEILLIDRYGSNNEPTFSTLSVAVTSWKNALILLTDADKREFIYRHRDRLQNIYTIIQTKVIPIIEDYIKYYESPQYASRNSNRARLRQVYIDSKRTFQSLRTDIFQNILNMRIGRNGAFLNTTFLFEDFMKGITYFADQAKAYPIYHRALSCGPYANQIVYRNENIKCDLQNIAMTDLERRRLVSEKCYTERVVYDTLYKSETLNHPVAGTEIMEQDEGHRMAIDQAKDDFSKCFPYESLIVTIEYDGSMPTILILERRKKNKIIYTTRYERSLVRNSASEYDEIVQCIRTTPKETYFKIQMFTDTPEQQAMPWRRIVSSNTSISRRMVVDLPESNRHISAPRRRRSAVVGGFGKNNT